MDETSLTLGYLVGRRIAGQRRKKTPIAYLYNGVQLPPLPEWDKEAYPYAYILYIESADSYRLILQQTYVESYNYKGETKVRENYDSWKALNAQTGLWTATRLRYDATGDAWEYVDSTTYNADAYPSNQLSLYAWTNYDITNADDGVVNLAASDPVPVYDSGESGG